MINLRQVAILAVGRIVGGCSMTARQASRSAVESVGSVLPFDRPSVLACFLPFLIAHAEQATTSDRACRTERNRIRLNDYRA